MLKTKNRLSLVTKRLSLGLILSLIVSALVTAQTNGAGRDGALPAAAKSSAQIPLPAEASKRLSDIQAAIARKEQEIQTLRLLLENAIFAAALDIGLNRTKLDTLQLQLNQKGEYVFVPAPPAPKKVDKGQ